MTKVEIENMIDKVDDNHNGSIDFEEFVELMFQKINSQDEQEEFLYAFRQYDQDGDGSISAQDFRKILNSLDVKISYQEIDSMMKDLNLNEDGHIDFQEFVRIMK